MIEPEQAERDIRAGVELDTVSRGKILTVEAPADAATSLLARQQSKYVRWLLLSLVSGVIRSFLGMKM